MLDSFRNVLVVAPHADDETLGAGGTIARLVAEGKRVAVAVMTGRGSEAHPVFPDAAFERVRREFAEAMSVLGVERTVLLDLPTTLLTETPVFEVNRAAAGLLADIRPDLVFLPFEHDLHRDHGILNYAFSVGLRAFRPENRRPHALLCYETPSETHLQGPYMRAAFDPHVWLDVSGHMDRKLAALDCFKSQIRPSAHPRSIDAVTALARWRGAQIGVEAAEAFVLLRYVE